MDDLGDHRRSGVITKPYFRISCLDINGVSIERIQNNRVVCPFVIINVKLGLHQSSSSGSFAVACLQEHIWAAAAHSLKISTGISA